MISDRAKRVSARRMRMDDANGRYEIIIPAEVSQTSGTENPFAVTSTEERTERFENVLTGWAPLAVMSQDEVADGFHIDLKSGRCVIPLARFGGDYEQAETLLTTEGAKHFMDGEQVEMVKVALDSLTDNVVVNVKRIEQ